SLPAVAGQGELRDDEQRPAGRGEIAVHPAGVVREHAQPTHLVDDVGEVGVGVAVHDAEEDQQASRDLAVAYAVDVYSRARDALDDGPHRAGPDAPARAPLMDTAASTCGCSRVSSRCRG